MYVRTYNPIATCNPCVIVQRCAGSLCNTYYYDKHKFNFANSQKCYLRHKKNPSSIINILVILLGFIAESDFHQKSEQCWLRIKGRYFWKRLNWLWRWQTVSRRMTAISVCDIKKNYAFRTFLWSYYKPPIRRILAYYSRNHMILI